MKLVKTLVNHGSDIGHTLSCLILEVRRSSFVLRLSRTIFCRPPFPVSPLEPSSYLFSFPFFSFSLRTSHIDVSRSPYREAENSITA